MNHELLPIVFTGLGSVGDSQKLKSIEFQVLLIGVELIQELVSIKGQKLVC